MLRHRAYAVARGPKAYRSLRNGEAEGFVRGLELFELLSPKSSRTASIADDRHRRLPVQPGGPASDHQSIAVAFFQQRLDGFDSYGREQGQRGNEIFALAVDREAI